MNFDLEAFSHNPADGSFATTAKLVRGCLFRYVLTHSRPSKLELTRSPGYDFGYVNGVTGSKVFIHTVEGPAAKALAGSRQSLTVSTLDLPSLAHRSHAALAD